QPVTLATLNLFDVRQFRRQCGPLMNEGVESILCLASNLFKERRIVERADLRLFQRIVQVFGDERTVCRHVWIDPHVSTAYARLVKCEGLAGLRLPQSSTKCRNPLRRRLFADHRIEQDRGEEEKEVTSRRTIAPEALNREILNFLLEALDH